MKRVGLFAAAIIATSLVLFPSCENGSTDGSADIEGIWVATGEDEGIGKAMLFEFSGNEFTRIHYTELTVGDDAPDMFQDEGNKGTYSVSDDILTVTVTQAWENAEWSAYSESRSVEIDLQGNTLVMDLGPMGPVNFDKKSFSRPSALVGTWYETSPSAGAELGVGAGGTYSYTLAGAGSAAAGTWSASPDLVRFITTDDSFYIENLYEYDLTGGTLTLSWDAEVFYEYTNVLPD